MRVLPLAIAVLALSTTAGAQSADADPTGQVAGLRTSAPSGVWGFDATAVGRLTDTEGRMAYWCLADCYRDVAKHVETERVAAIAERVASQYKRAAPTWEQVAGLGLTSGDRVTIDHGDDDACTTTVR